MQLAHVFAVIEKESDIERLCYLDEDENWTYDLQKAKIYDTDDIEIIMNLEESYEAMAWSVIVQECGSIQSLSAFMQEEGE